MDEITIITDAVHSAPAEVVGGAILVEPNTLASVVGWELKPEGLCREDVCVPVRDRAAIEPTPDRVDVVAVAGLLGRPVVSDADAGVIAIGLPADARTRMVRDGVAPDFTLPDLGGTLHRFSEWEGSKRLLVAFATW